MAIEPTTSPESYAALLADLKQRIDSARLKAALSVNRELVLLYWSIGRDILTRQGTEGWGTKVIDRLAADLRRSFPEMTGLSARNLKYMRAFAEAWPDQQFVQQLVALLPVGSQYPPPRSARNAEPTRMVRSPSYPARLEPQRPHPSD
jgi:predicted nuclease of restriction endonuclease-like (RecB) superfamily